MFLKKGFALITVLIISTILFGVIGFTFIAANRNLNLKSILHLSKTSLTTADAGLEELIRDIQSHHFDNISLYLLKLYKQNLDSNPVIFNYIPQSLKDEKFKDPRTGNYILTRAKYFLDFSFYDLDDEGNPVPKKWRDLDDDGVVEESEVTPAVENPEIRVQNWVIDFIQSLTRPNDDSIISAIVNDIQNAYNQWMAYLWGINWNVGFKTTDSGEELGVMEEMVKRISGDDLQPNCPDNLDLIIKPYDIDNPVTNETYEGLIVRTAGKIDTSENSPSRGLIILTSIGYSFNLPVPRSEYESVIKPRLKLVCPRPNDPEYTTHYINVLDVDAVNNSLKLAGSRYRVTPMKRGIRGEFEVKYEAPANNIIQTLRNAENITTTTFQDQVSFSDYLIASNETVNFGYDEEVHGPIRSNANINFSGKIWDTITASGYVRDYITFGPYANQHTGAFYFSLNGVEYKVQPFKNSSGNSPNMVQATITPPLINNGQQYSTVYIVKKPNIEEYYVDLSPWNSELNYDVLVYKQQQGTMDFSRVQTAGNDIKTIAQNTGYYFNGTSKAVELHFLENGNIQVKEGNGPTRILPMPDNTPVTLPDGTVYNGGVIYVQGDVTVRGKVNGRVTVYASRDVWIESDLTYVHPAVIDPNTTPNYIPDALGLIAYRNVVIHKNAPEHLRIDAAVLAQTGWFGIDPNANYHPYNPNGHVLDFRGSQTFFDADWAPAIVSGNRVKGYETQLTYYDYNLRRARPPMFPTLGNEVIIRIPITQTHSYNEENLLGPLKSTLFGRILWREMVNPP
ncbi:MAG: hypothetical protein QXP60_08900 [Nitrososphaerota archaeon]